MVDGDGKMNRLSSQSDEWIQRGRKRQQKVEAPWEPTRIRCVEHDIFPPHPDDGYDLETAFATAFKEEHSSKIKEEPPDEREGPPAQVEESPRRHDHPERAHLDCPKCSARIGIAFHIISYEVRQSGSERDLVRLNGKPVISPENDNGDACKHLLCYECGCKFCPCCVVGPNKQLLDRDCRSRSLRNALAMRLFRLNRVGHRKDGHQVCTLPGCCGN